MGPFLFVKYPRPLRVKIKALENMTAEENLKKRRHTDNVLEGKRVKESLKTLTSKF